MFRPSLFLLFVVLLSISALSGEAKQKKGQPEKHATKHHHGPTNLFCKSFIKQCYHEALNGKTGKINVQFACERHHHKKKAAQFSFSCKADGVDLTNQVLTMIGGSGTLSEVTLPVETLTNTNYVSEVVANMTNVNVATVTNQAFQTLTTVIPVTATEVSMSTVTTTTPITSVATSTATNYMLNQEPVPVMRVSVVPSNGRKRFAKVDPSTFCSVYSSACQSQCSKFKSKPKHLVCQSNALYNYSLTCYCANKKVRTQHALAAAVGQQNIASVSTIDTSTSFGTATSTNLVPTTYLSTTVATVTATVPVTNTYTSYSTATQTATLTQTTGAISTVATSIPVSVVTNTATSTTLISASTTTQIIVAPTGAVEAVALYGGPAAYKGYLFNNDGNIDITLNRQAATTFGSIFDPTSGLYQLGLLDGTGSVVAAVESDLGTSYQEYILIPTQAANCGTSGSAAGPAMNSIGSNVPPCQTFIFSPQVDTETYQDGTVNLLGEFVGDGSSTLTQYSWVLSTGGTPSAPTPGATTSGVTPQLLAVNNLSQFLENSGVRPLILRFSA